MLLHTENSAGHALINLYGGAKGNPHTSQIFPERKKEIFHLVLNLGTENIILKAQWNNKPKMFYCRNHKNNENIS